MMLLSQFGNFPARESKINKFVCKTTQKSQVVLNFFFVFKSDPNIIISFNSSWIAITTIYQYLLSKCQSPLNSLFIKLLQSTLAFRKHIIIKQQNQQVPMELHFKHNSPLFYILSDGQEYNYSGEIDLMIDQGNTWNGLAGKSFNTQMEEIINKFVSQCPLGIQDQSEPQISMFSNQNHAGFQKTSNHSDQIRKIKKVKKTENSPFHNYQKHLNNALKKLIIVPEFQPDCEQYKQVACQIWDIYCRSNINTKRILHFIFNEKNQHTINVPQLKTYRLWNVYKTYQPDIIAKAKNYLSKLAINQLDQQNVDGYLKTRKLKKNRDCLKGYILGFKSQLEKGYIKRRIIGEKTQNDQ